MCRVMRAEGCSGSQQVLPELDILQVLVKHCDREVLRYQPLRECSVQSALLLEHVSGAPQLVALREDAVQDVKEHPRASSGQSRIVRVMWPPPGLVPFTIQYVLHDLHRSTSARKHKHAALLNTCSASLPLSTFMAQVYDPAGLSIEASWFPDSLQVDWFCLAPRCTTRAMQLVSA